jgi:hypothetical protein
MTFSTDVALKIIVPAPYIDVKSGSGYSGYSVVEHYRQCYCEEHCHERWFEDTKFFTHDPEWKNRFLSIQSARDGNHPVWKVAHIITRFGYIASATGPLSSFFMI